MNKEIWQNNIVGKYLYDHCPHDFGYMDGDGVNHKDYGFGCRIVYLEVKHWNEHLSDSEWIILRDLAKMPWEQSYDDLSGVFMLRHNEELTHIDVYKFYKNTDASNLTLWRHFDNMNQIYEWLSAKDKSSSRYLFDKDRALLRAAFDKAFNRKGPKLFITSSLG